MKHFLLGAALATLVGSALAATNVGVSVTVGQPGFYGRIVLGDMPQPQVIYAAPVIIQQAPVGYDRQPIYLRVRPGHEKHWEKHCRKYKACGQPVYFVQDNWYQNEYAPAYRENHGERGNRHEDHDNNGHGHGHGHDKGRGND